MGLRTQLSGFTVILLLVLAGALTTVTVVSIQWKGREDVARYEAEQYEKLQSHLRGLVDVAAGMIDKKHRQMQDMEYLTKYIRENLFAGDTAYYRWADEELLSNYRVVAQDYLRAELLNQIADLSYDRGAGYYWITNDVSTYPTMIMDAGTPTNNGKVLSDESYNVEKERGRNVFQQRVRLSKQNADSAFVEYTATKSGTERVFNKMSYSFWFQPLGWVVSTGVEIDDVLNGISAFEAGVDQQLRSTVRVLLLTVFISLLIGAGLAIRFGISITNPVKEMQEKLEKLARGEAVTKLETKRTDELGEMVGSLNELVEGMGAYTEFANAIRKGDLNASFTSLSDDDVLGKALLEMQTSLQASKTQEEIQNWMSNGAAKFGELFNHYSENLHHLLETSLREMIKYMGVNQGAIYLKEGGDKDPHMERKAYYAYERQKKAYQRINPGDGLIGQCMLEQETLYITEVPANYVNINSGLGQATPTCIVIFPIHNNGVFYGAVELAAFHALEKYEVTFMEKTCELLAVSLNTVRATHRTSQLLSQSQSLSEELRSQEEELRQNQEELQATHEETRRKMAELEAANARLRREHTSLENENQALKVELLEWKGQESAA
ncbi:MAG: cache domain-containing protein [Bacteroidota bacterium]